VPVKRSKSKVKGDGQVWPSHTSIAFPTASVATEAKVGLPLRDAIHALLAPPAQHLLRVGDGLEDAGRRRGDENLANQCVFARE